jgi:hypothetical protein
VLPERCIVAHNGMAKPAMSSLTPFFIVCFNVTGIVAAEDCVPNAVKYAGSILKSSFSGFLLTNSPAMAY